MRRDLPRADVAEDPCEIQLLLQNGAGGLVEGDAEFVGDDGGKGCFAESGRSVKQNVIECFPALARRLDANGVLLFQLCLAGEIFETPRPETGFNLPFLLLHGR